LRKSRTVSECSTTASQADRHDDVQRLLDALVVTDRQHHHRTVPVADLDFDLAGLDRAEKVEDTGR
jgi:hypothetical protein